MAALAKSTHIVANHQIPIPCDVYQAFDYPHDAPVFLYFHSGGLVAGSRVDVPPWLVQTCFRRKWPLVSSSYRLVPQVGGDGLLEDVRAAFGFCLNLGGSSQRKVIVGGGSAGFVLAALAAHHCMPKPIALLSETGIPTFRHPFFNSSTLLLPEPIREEEVEQWLAEDVAVGTTPFDPFCLAKLQRSGAKDPDFDPKTQEPVDRMGQDPNRGMLYDYYLYANMYEPIMGAVDVGFQWTDDAEKLAKWPITLFIQGDEDTDVDADVTVSVANRLGDRARLFLAKGQPHLYEKSRYAEDDGPGMNEVRAAVAELDRVVAAQT